MLVFLPPLGRFVFLMLLDDEHGVGISLLLPPAAVPVIARDLLKRAKCMWRWKEKEEEGRWYIYVSMGVSECVR